MLHCAAPVTEGFPRHSSGKARQQCGLAISYPVIEVATNIGFAIQLTAFGIAYAEGNIT